MADDAPPRTIAELGLAVEQALGNGKPLPWPDLPPIGASELDLRVYLTAALGLVPGYHVERVERHGPYGTDSCVIGIRTPTGRTVVRFDALDHIAKPQLLRPTVAGQLHGMTMMRKIDGVMAYDVFLAVCRLASVVEHATHIDETLGYLRDYVDAGDRLYLPFGTPEDRYDSLGHLKARQVFDHAQASAFLRRDLAPESRWAVIVDAAEAGRAWIRTGEFQTYLRHVIALPAVPARIWNAKVYEAGGTFVRMVADGRRGVARRGFRRELKLYLLPETVAAAVL